MDFCGSKIKSGDAVFDVALGNGVVTEIVNGSIIAKFGGRHLRYDKTGRTKSFSNRTLYWKDPFYGIEPPKDSKHWQAFINSAKTLSEELITLDRQNVV